MVRTPHVGPGGDAPSTAAEPALMSPTRESKRSRVADDSSMSSAAAGTRAQSPPAQPATYMETAASGLPRAPTPQLPVQLADTPVDSSREREPDDLTQLTDEQMVSYLGTHLLNVSLRQVARGDAVKRSTAPLPHPVATLPPGARLRRPSAASPSRYPPEAQLRALIAAAVQAVCGTAPRTVAGEPDAGYLAQSVLLRDPRHATDLYTKREVTVFIHEDVHATLVFTRPFLGHTYLIEETTLQMLERVRRQAQAAQTPPAPAHPLAEIVSAYKDYGVRSLTSLMSVDGSCSFLRYQMVLARPLPEASLHPDAPTEKEPWTLDIPYRQQQRARLHAQKRRQTLRDKSAPPSAPTTSSAPDAAPARAGDAPVPSAAAPAAAEGTAPTPTAAARDPVTSPAPQRSAARDSSSSSRHRRAGSTTDDGVSGFTTVISASVKKLVRASHKRTVQENFPAFFTIPEADLRLLRSYKRPDTGYSNIFGRCTVQDPDEKWVQLRRTEIANNEQRAADKDASKGGKPRGSIDAVRDLERLGHISAAQRDDCEGPACISYAATVLANVRRAKQHAAAANKKLARKPTGTRSRSRSPRASTDEDHPVDMQVDAGPTGTAPVVVMSDDASDAPADSTSPRTRRYRALLAAEATDAEAYRPSAPADAARDSMSDE